MPAGAYTDVTGERADAARNRARLLAAATRLVTDHGAARVTMDEVARAAGVGKATLFRRFGDRNGLLLALLDDVEVEFRERYACGPPPLGPGVPARDRLTAFGSTLIERIADDMDLGAALAREVPCERRHTSATARAFHEHVSSLLEEAGLEGDRDMLAHALLAFASFETLDHLRGERQVGTERLQSTWGDLVRRVTGADGA